MTFEHPIETRNGVISCPTCSTEPLLDLELPRLSYIEVPSLKPTITHKPYDFNPLGLVPIFLVVIVALFIGYLIYAERKI